MDTGVEEMTKWQNSFEGFGGNPERRNLRKWFFPEKKIIFESQKQLTWDSKINFS